MFCHTSRVPFSSKFEPAQKIKVIDPACLDSTLHKIFGNGLEKSHSVETAPYGEPKILEIKILESFLNQNHQLVL